MILDRIVADKKLRLGEHKARVDMKTMKQEAERSDRISYSFYDALAKEGLSIIGECKKASPSMGTIDGKIDIADRVAGYNDSVDCISVLTEEDHFSGNIEDLKAVRRLSKLPIIRKDFVIDEYQIYEAKVAGADAILLIAAILNDDDMKRFYELAYSLGLDVLVEVHDEKEMTRALKINPQILGVNNRNLKDFTIDLSNTKRLMDMAPEDKVFVSESGVTTDEDIKLLKKWGVKALLIGRALMETRNPKALAVHWKEIYKKDRG